MVECEICHKYYKNIQGLSQHIGAYRKQISKEEYYLKYLKLNDNGICPICGKPTPFFGLSYGFQKHCSAKCAGIDEQTKVKRENTNIQIYGTNYNFQNQEWREDAKKIKLERYGDENYNNRELFKQTSLERYGVDNPRKSKDVCDKVKKTNIERYGVDVSSKSEQVKEKLKKTCQQKYGEDSYFQTDEFKNKAKQTSLDKYGAEYPMQTDEIKQKVHNTCLERYSVSSATLIPTTIEKANSKEAMKKTFETKRKNGTFNTSKPEDEAYEELLKIFGTVKRQYKSEVYPFLCDFYIPSEDLYIELNLHWTHGFHWFDENSKEDQETLEKWKEKAKNSKYYQYAIDTWTVRDVEKRQIVEENKINYLVFWSKQSFYDYIKEIGVEH